MRLANWFRNRLTIRGKALSLYQRGMVKAKRHDQWGAIADYTRAIDLPNAPADVVAMALFNRSLVHVAAGEFGNAADDLTAVLEMEEAPANVKKMAKQKLAKRGSHTRNSAES